MTYLSGNSEKQGICIYDTLCQFQMKAFYGSNTVVYSI